MKTWPLSARWLDSVLLMVVIVRDGMSTVAAAGAVAPTSSAAPSSGHTATSTASQRDLHMITSVETAERRRER